MEKGGWFMLLINHEGMRTVAVSREIVTWQWTVLMSIGRCFVYQRHLQSMFEAMEASDYKASIVHTHNAMLEMFLINWCKIFGANNNEIHWKKAYLEHRTVHGNLICTRQNYEQNVRDYFLGKADLDGTDFTNIHQSMTDSRNNYVAHCNPYELCPIPFLDDPYLIADGYADFLSGAEGVRLRSLSYFQPTFTREVELAFPALDNN